MQKRLRSVKKKNFKKFAKCKNTKIIFLNNNKTKQNKSFRTLRLGVKGSGSLMLRGKALSMRFLIWMQFGGITSQNEK